MVGGDIDGATMGLIEFGKRFTFVACGGIGSR